MPQPYRSPAHCAPEPLLPIVAVFGVTTVACAAGWLLSDRLSFVRLRPPAILAENDSLTFLENAHFPIAFVLSAIVLHVAVALFHTPMRNREFERIASLSKRNDAATGLRQRSV
jgi:hypothetical protein